MLPYLIAGAIGYGIAKLFEDDKLPKYVDGGNIDYSDFRTSVIGLMNDNKVLILQRGSTANWMPNKWSVVGGVIEEGEVPLEAIIRECEEEIGLKPSNVYYDHKIMTNDSGEIYYFLGTLKNRNIKLDYENSAYKFISKDEINNYDFVPYVKEFILEIFSRNEKKSGFKRGGDILLAPNGKPSNLTPEQYKLVRTPAFKKWFGDWENDPSNASKVVDENGEPLVCYHTSNKKFTKFDYELSYDGAIWFTSNLKKIYDKETGASGSGIIYQVFLDIKKMGDWDDYDKGISDLLRDKFNGAELDDDYIVFEPNQIKLADGSNTTFDSNNPDIRFDGGGRINKTNPYIYNNPKLVKMIEDSIEKDGSSFICTYVASAVKMLEGSNVKIYGFSIYNNPDAEYFSDEEGDEGHHFAVLDDRYILDAWIYNNYQDYQANITFNRSVFDLQNKEDEKIIKYLYGNRNKWVDITKNVEDFKDLFPLTYKDLINGYKNLSL
jgi:8-oxo-dGTP pyrophosphatase MutT (NUDIX family)